MFTFRQSCRICCQNRLQLHSVSCLTISVKYTLLEASQTQPHIIICCLPKRKQQRPKFLIAFTFRQSCRICYQNRLYSYIIIPCMLCLTISLKYTWLEANQTRAYTYSRFHFNKNSHVARQIWEQGYKH